MTEGTCSAASRHLLPRHQESTKKRKKASEATIRETWAELGQEGTRGSEIEGSEMARNLTRKSFEENESNVDLMEHYKCILSKMLRGQDDSFCKGVNNEVQGTSTQNKGKEGYICKRTFPLFKEQFGGLSKNDKEKIKLALHEIITFLNNDVDEVDRDIQAMEESGETCQEVVKKLSTGLLGKLGKMAQGVDDLLNTAASKCRPMSTEEKIELGKCIRKLPEEALNRLVEIITRRKLASENSDRITMNLGELDDATLWRLYYHVEYALKENKK
ncbi:uncharacterized protein LOC120708994 isoform X2 [Panicum virgatum]|uniref:NET domain-containing protein n=1 Tax=Panicum virgatum TaxID=38727 RepID=A0A8T0T086_PANVG|nr:uncharacterized protein LOC120708994 isoform X2 [Panicum virgatum]KAG2602754.1 hypothetical protein PVAP13_5KG706900 [Panicum virgatum]